MGSIGTGPTQTSGSGKINRRITTGLETQINNAQLPEDLNTVLENIQQYKSEFPDSYDVLRELELKAKREQADLMKNYR